MNRIKQLRQEKKLSIDQLSNELKKRGVSISPASISKYEREARNPKIENWDALANYFNVSVDYFKACDINFFFGFKLMPSNTLEEAKAAAENKN